jgi:hypothetical protein
VHSFTSTQVVPLNVYPGLHVQLKLPVVFAQVPGPQRFGFCVHSLTSTQVVPLNEYPALHVQLKLPAELTQVPWPHRVGFVVHSLMSVHTSAVPVCPLPE